MAAEPLSELWLDAQLPPDLARWLREQGLSARSLRELGLESSSDHAVFMAARQKAVSAIMPKDADLAALVQRLGQPPKVIWLTCGNTSNAELKRTLSIHLARVEAFLRGVDALLEIAGG